MTFDWKNPNYDAVYEERVARLENLRSKPEILPSLREFYKNNPSAFINDWGMTFDPRNAEVGLPTVIPFVLFPRQVEYIDWLRDLWLNRRDGLAEKSRDMGVSWLCVAFAHWMWEFHPGTVVGFGSRKEEYVDKIGDPKSLFWKLRQYISLLPAEFVPNGYDERKHAPHMRVVNPENGSTIIGEAGDNIGRGNRTSIYFKDEAQPLGARVLTPTGWQTMNDMRIGSRVVGADGLPRTVQHIRDSVARVYRVTFSDGTSVEASHNHLWAVTNVIGKRRDLTLRTHEIAASFSYVSPGGQTQYRLRVPVTCPVQFDEAAPLPLHPYIVGALLGDGSVGAGTPRITTADKQIVDEIAALLPEGCMLSEPNGISFRLVSSFGRGKGRRGDRNAVKRAVTEAGIAGMRSYDKHIPSKYLFSSVDARLALLQGLMDTDGSASGGVASFHSSSARLADDVRFIVESLGGTATLNVKPDYRGHRDMYVLHIALSMPLFRLSRKLSALSPRKHPAGRTIVAVEALDEQHVRCISVDGELYLTDHCVVTHNCAFYEHAEAIDAALSQTSNCKIDVSTPNGPGNPFYRKAHGGKVSKFVFDWRSDPRKDDAWYQHQCDTLDPVIVAQEIDRNYEGSVTDAFIPGDVVTLAMMRGPADIMPIGNLRVGVDVARFGDDKTVISYRRGRVLLRQTVRQKLDVTQVAALVRNEVMSYGQLPVEQIAVDTIGIGAGVADILRGWFPDRTDPRTGVVTQTVRDVNSSLRMDDGINYNMRAFMANEVKAWLVGASIPNDPDLKTDLTALRYSFRGGELLIESKEDAKRRGIKSPDRFDSLALTFAYPTIVNVQPPAVVTEPYRPHVPGVM